MLTLAKAHLLGVILLLILVARLFVHAGCEYTACCLVIALAAVSTWFVSLAGGMYCAHDTVGQMDVQTSPDTCRRPDAQMSWAAQRPEREPYKEWEGLQCADGTSRLENATCILLHDVLYWPRKRSETRHVSAALCTLCKCTHAVTLTRRLNECNSGQN